MLRLVINVIFVGVFLNDCLMSHVLCLMSYVSCANINQSSASCLIVPDAEKYGAARWYADVDVGYDDFMEVTVPLVGKEQIGHPDFIVVSQRQVLEFTCRWCEHNQLCKLETDYASDEQRQSIIYKGKGEMKAIENLTKLPLKSLYLSLSSNHSSRNVIMVLYS